MLPEFRYTDIPEHSVAVVATRDPSDLEMGDQDGMETVIPADQHLSAALREMSGPVHLTMDSAAVVRLSSLPSSSFPGVRSLSVSAFSIRSADDLRIVSQFEDLRILHLRGAGGDVVRNLGWLDGLDQLEIFSSENCENFREESAATLPPLPSLVWMTIEAVQPNPTFLRSVVRLPRLRHLRVIGGARTRSVWIDELLYSDRLESLRVDGLSGLSGKRWPRIEGRHDRAMTLRGLELRGYEADPGLIDSGQAVWLDLWIQGRMGRETLKAAISNGAIRALALRSPRMGPSDTRAISSSADGSPLQAICLDGLVQADQSVGDALRRFVDLRYLALNRCQLAPSSFWRCVAEMPRLRAVLVRSSVPIDGLGALAQSPSLRVLDLSRAQISEGNATVTALAERGILVSAPSGTWSMDDKERRRHIAKWVEPVPAGWRW